VEGLTLSNIRITTRERGRVEWANRGFLPEFGPDYPESICVAGNLPAYGLFCRHVDGLRMRNMEYVMEEPDARPALIFDDVKNLDMDGFAASPPAASGLPLIRFKEVRRAFVRGCSSPRGGHRRRRNRQ
jgi:hypothetical protein